MSTRALHRIREAKFRSSRGSPLTGALNRHPRPVDSDILAVLRHLSETARDSIYVSIV